MALSAAAENELRAALKAFRAAHRSVTIPGGDGKALEAWIVMKLAQAAKLMPSWTVSLRRGDGSLLPPGTDFAFPGQGSRIQPSSINAPGYVLLEHKQHTDRHLELRGSVQWMGRSSAKHECDISVLPAVIGEALRKNGGGHPHGLPIVAIECKDKTAVGTLDETRQKLARMFDLVLVTQPDPSWSCRIYETITKQKWGRRSSKYVSFFAKGTFAILRANAFQSGVHKLATHYHIERFPSIYDTSSGSMTALLSRFRKTLDDIHSY
jgi:hypothetical protein